MQYVTIQEVKLAFGEAQLEQLTESTPDNLNLELIEAVNAQAVGEVHSYLQGVYELPLTVSDEPMIVSLVLDLMKYRLFKRRDQWNLSDSALALYKQIVSLLEKIRQRDVRLSSALLQVSTDTDSNTQTGDVRYVTKPQKFKQGFTGL